MDRVEKAIEDFFLAHKGQSKEEIAAYNRQYYLRNKNKWNVQTEAKVAAAEKKLQRARAAAKKLPPDKRNALEKKIDAAQAKLNSLKKKIKNPFQSKTKVTTRVVGKPVITDTKRAGGGRSINIKDVKRAGAGRSTSITDRKRFGSGQSRD